MPSKLTDILCSSTNAGHKKHAVPTSPFRTLWRAAATAIVLGWTLLGAQQIVAQVPDPPSNLTATPVSASEIDLAWVNATGGPTRIENRIFRSRDGINFALINTVGRNDTMYSDKGLLPSTRYYYYVKAHNSSGDSDPSNTASAITDIGPPALRLADVCPGRISVAWSAVADDHYDILRSLDGMNFDLIQTVPASQTSFMDSGLDFGTYYYRVDGFRMDGQSARSNIIKATIGPVGLAIDHSNGFADHSDLKDNVDPPRNIFPDTVARLTDGNGGERATIFANDKVDITNFATSFTFKIHDPTSQDSWADGMTFVIQNDTRGANALGPAGGGLAYGPDNRGGDCRAADSIRNSVAIKFDIYSNEGEGVNSTGIFTDGRSPTLRCAAAPPDAPDMSVDLTGSGITLRDEHVKQVDLMYDGTTLTETITDLDSPNMVSFTTSYTVDIPRWVGDNTAYVGLGGTTGGIFAFQDILTWTFSGPDQPLRTPSNLRVTNVTGSSVTITWKCNNAFGATGYKIERSDDGGDFVQIDMVGIQTSYTDMALAAGKYTYRVRAFNDEDNSPYSNVDSVTIPPPSVVDHSAGFATHDDLTGNATGGRNIFVAGVARLTTGGFAQAGSVFFNDKVDITSFTNTFNFQICVILQTCATAVPADGMTFTIQGNNPMALGATGGALGYAGISNSVAIKFDIFDNEGEGNNSTGLFTDGHLPGVPHGPEDVLVDLTGTGIDLKNGDVFNVFMAYDGAALTVTITDTVTEVSATQTYTVDIASVVGSNVAYVGFTGSTGGNTARQDVQTWTFQSGLGAGKRQSRR